MSTSLPMVVDADVALEVASHVPGHGALAVIR